MGLRSALQKAVRWIVIALLVSVALEMTVSAAIERMNIVAPSNERRAVCNDCTGALHRFDTSVKELVLDEAHRLSRSSQEKSVSGLVSAALAAFTANRRKELARQAAGIACRSAESPKTCQAALQRHKAAAVRSASSSDALFHHAVRAAVLSRFSDDASVAELNSNTVLLAESVSIKPSSATVCASVCQRTTLLELLIPATVFSDPTLKLVLAFLSEMWGTILIVGIIATLLVMTLHVRASAARRQHQLYQRLLQQFHGRVTTTQAATPGGKRQPAVATGPNAAVRAASTGGH